MALNEHPGVRRYVVACLDPTCRVVSKRGHVRALQIAGLALAVLVLLARPAHATFALYVVNEGNNDILKFDAAGNVTVFATNGVNGAVLSNPTGIALDSAGNVYVANSAFVANTNDTVVVFDPTGHGQPFAYPGQAQGSVVYQGMVFDSAGNLIIANESGDRIIKVANGTHSALILYDSNLSELFSPFSVAFDNAGRLYVANVGNNWIERFAYPSTNATQFVTNFANPTGLAFDAAGNLYVPSAHTSDIWKFDTNGQNRTLFASAFTNSMGTPYGLAFDGSGNLWVADNSFSKIYKYGPGGGTGTVFAASSKGLNHPYFIAIQDPQADLAVTKTVDKTNAIVGDTVTFSITVTNSGPSAASPVVVAEQLLTAGLTNISFTNFYVNSSFNGTNWTITNLPAATTAQLNVRALVTAAGSQTNRVSIQSSGSGDPNTNNNVALATVLTRLPTADLAVTKTVDKTNAIVGDTVTFSITVTNPGPDAAGLVVVKEQLVTAGLTNISFNNFYANSGFDGTNWSITNLLAGAAAQLTITAGVTASGLQTNIAAIQSSTVNDPNTNNNTAVATVLASLPTADLALTKTVDQPSAYVGDPVTFSITVTNPGPGAASLVVVHEQLVTAGLTNISFNNLYANSSFNGTDWSITNLAAGAAAQLNITARLTATGVQTNNAAIQSATVNDPNPNNNSASATVLASPPPTNNVGTAYADSGDFTIDTTGTTPNTGGVAQSDSADFTIDTTGAMVSMAQADSGDFIIDTTGTPPTRSGVASADSGDFAIDTTGTLAGTSGVAQSDFGDFTIDTTGVTGTGGVAQSDSLDFILDTRGLAQVFSLLSPLVLPNGVFQFSFTNTPGLSFSVYSVTDLTLPFNAWTFLGTVTDNPPGQFQFNDPQWTNYPQRYYRVSSP